MAKKPYRTNRLGEIAKAAGARPASEKQYRAEEGTTSLVFRLPGGRARRMRMKRKA